jgi:hypothetical protein
MKDQKDQLDYLELRKEKALNKVVELFEAGCYVYHTNIAKEFGIDLSIMRKMLKNQPDNLFEKMKNQNRRLTLNKVNLKHITRDSSKREAFDEIDLRILKELRRKTKVVVKLPNENDLDFKLFKSKIVGGEFPKEHHGSFNEYVCGAGRKQINY